MSCDPGDISWLLVVRLFCKKGFVIPALKGCPGDVRSTFRISNSWTLRAPFSPSLCPLLLFFSLYQLKEAPGLGWPFWAPILPCRSLSLAPPGPAPCPSPGESVSTVNTRPFHCFLVVGPWTSGTCQALLTQQDWPCASGTRACVPCNGKNDQISNTLDKTHLTKWLEAFTLAPGFSPSYLD